MLLGLSIILFLWITQVVFLQVYTNRTKKSEFVDVGQQLLSQYYGEYRKEFGQIANRSSCSVDLLKREGEGLTVEYTSAGVLFGDEGATVSSEGAVGYLAGNADYRSGVFRTDEATSQLLYGVYADTACTKLLVVSQSNELFDKTTKILQIQMTIATIIILVLSFGVSMLMSSAFSQDLRRLSESAKRLKDNDLTVHFDEKGFSEAKELARTLNYATEELQKTEKLRQELISNVSHDLRTPLTIIKGYAEMLRDITGGDPVKREAQLEVIIKESDRLSGLVNDLLELSRAQNQGKPLEKERVDLAAIIDRALVSFDVLIKREGYTLERQVGEELWVMGDPKQIELTVYNLVANAINYSGREKYILVSAVKEDGRVKVKVQDHGVGIPEEQLATIWQRYYRTEHEREVVGTGLGLSIVQTILTRHGAEFGVESQVGEGSTFWFDLPLA
ncbi:MAG: hypothetical protein J5755_02070 [Clostridia bacterium]|nr:hypothetical protein [Clostridia bacterium]